MFIIFRFKVFIFIKLLLHPHDQLQPAKQPSSSHDDDDDHHHYLFETEWKMRNQKGY